MCMCYDIMPNIIVDKYNLHQLTNCDRWDYIEIMKGVYSHPHAGLLAINCLTIGWLPMPSTNANLTQGLWRHVWLPITVLAVNDFGVKCGGTQKAKYLIDTLTSHYQILFDQGGKFFVVNPLIGITLKMGQSYNALIHHKNAALLLTCQAMTPTTCTTLPWFNKVGNNAQTAPVYTSNLLSPEKLKKVQKIVSTLLYYFYTMDPMMAADWGCPFGYCQKLIIYLHVTWSSWCIQMPHTWQNLDKRVEHMEITF